MGFPPSSNYRKYSKGRLRGMFGYYASINCVCERLTDSRSQGPTDIDYRLVKGQFLLRNKTYFRGNHERIDSGYKDGPSHHGASTCLTNKYRSISSGE